MIKKLFDKIMYISIRKKKIFFTTISLFFSLMFLFPVFVNAAPNIVPASSLSKTPVVTTGYTKPEEVQEFAKQLNEANIKSPEDLIARIIKIALQSVGVITLGFFIYSGTLFMVSGGNAEQQGKAIKILVWTTLGVVVISGAYMFVNYVFTKIIR